MLSTGHSWYLLFEVPHSQSHLCQKQAVTNFEQIQADIQVSVDKQ